MAVSDVMPVWSDRCGLDELFFAWQADEVQRSRLGLEAGWPCRWTASWRTSEGDLACAVRDLAEVPVAGVVPAGGQTGKHIPDYLAVLRDGSRWLIDVRPASLVKDEDAVRFAAAAGGGPAPESHRAHGDRRR